MKYSDLKTVGEQTAFDFGRAVRVFTGNDSDLVDKLSRQYAHHHALSVFPRLDYVRGYNRLITAFRAGAGAGMEIKL